MLRAVWTPFNNEKTREVPAELKKFNAEVTEVLKIQEQRELRAEQGEEELKLPTVRLATSHHHRTRIEQYLCLRPGLQIKL